MTATIPAPTRAGSLALLRRLLGYLAPHRRLAAAGVAFLLANLACELALPWLLGRTMEGMLAPGGLGPAVLGLVVLGVGIARSAARYGQGVAQIRLAQRVITDLRLAYHRRVLALAFADHDELRRGELIARATRDVEKTRSFFVEIVFQAVELAILFAGSLAVMALAAPVFSLVSGLLLAVTATAMALAGAGLRRRSRAEDDAYDEVATAIQENVAGTRVVKAFGQERREMDRFDGRLSTYLARSFRVWDFFSYTLPIANMSFGLSIPIVLAAGGWLVLEGRLGLGEVTAAILYLNLIQGRLRGVGRIVQSTQVAAASAERIFEILDRPDRIAVPAAPKALPPGRGRIEFEGVSFAYGTGPAVLAGIDLAVEPGETVAVVGPTGSGKSSLICLLGRFHDPTAGRILLDGVDLRDLDPHELRRHVGLAFQETFLFSATVADNVAFGQPGASREAIERAARLARADGFVRALPRGYETVIGERGVTLSGGQKQRLSIARAILPDPRVLVLDDATASVDSRTEEEMQEGIQVAGRGRTTIVIAQRLSTVRRADRIVVLEGGRIADAGTHDELVERGGWYAEIHRAQQMMAVIEE